MHRKSLFGKMWQPIERNRLHAMFCLVVVLVISIGCPVCADDAAQRPSNTNSGQLNVDALNALVDKFEVKYKSTLMNRTYAPFLADCISGTLIQNRSLIVLLNSNICTTYFDLMYNMLDLPGFGTVEEIEETTREFDNDALATNFCNLFPGEVETELAKRPFTDASGKTVEKKLQSFWCQKDCIDLLPVFKIRPICKLIAGGCRVINLSKRKQSPAPPKINGTVANGGRGATDAQSKGPIPERKEPASKPSESDAPKESKVSLPSAAVGDKKSVLPVPAKGSDTAKVPNVNPSNVISDGQGDDNIGGEAEQSEDTANEQPLEEQKEAENEDTDNVDALDNEDKHEQLPAVHKHAPDVQQNRPDTQNSNNQHSRLSANVNEFRHDADPSFFSYFMFVMFGVIFVYVAYHNKSKILALLIEGRRSRTYSSRNGSRRKAHSAEYRKLDSNLEEAIQSGGGSQALSSQIIY